MRVVLVLLSAPVTLHARPQIAAGCTSLFPACTHTAVPRRSALNHQTIQHRPSALLTSDCPHHSGRSLYSPLVVLHTQEAVQLLLPVIFSPHAYQPGICRHRRTKLDALRRLSVHVYPAPRSLAVTSVTP